MKIKYIITAVLLLGVCTVNAQKEYSRSQETVIKLSEIPDYRIGEQLPGFKLKLINSAQRTASTADFNDRLLIIDFWGLGCSTCIEVMPHMDALQRQFGNKIKILPVAVEQETLILPFWKKNKHLKSLTLSSVVEDRDLNHYFEKSNIPHEVWVYKGKVIAITNHQYVTAENIKKILSGATVKWPVKNDFYVFDATKEALFKPDPNQVDTGATTLQYAAISDYKEINGTSAAGSQGMMPQIVRDAGHKLVRAFFLNTSIYLAYIRNWAMSGGSTMRMSMPPQAADQLYNKVAWEVADRSKYVNEPGSGIAESGWLSDHAICFESQYPDTGQTDQEIYKKVLTDLDHLLGLHVRWEKRKEKVLVLMKTGNLDRFKSKVHVTLDHVSLNRSFETYVQKGNLHQFRDASINSLVYKLNAPEKNPYVYDETGYKENLDLDLNFSSWSDIPAVRKALAAYGLELREEERQVDRFVFSEIDGGLVIDAKMAAEAKAKIAAQKDMANPAPEENKAFLSVNKKKAGIVTLPSGLQYRIIKQGTGAKPGINDKVTVHYTGTLVNGKIFDSSLNAGKVVTFRLTEVVKGFQEALQLMPGGSKWMIYIPAELAYGTHTNSGQLPPNSTLIFELELIGVVK